MKRQHDLYEDLLEQAEREKYIRDIRGIINREKDAELAELRRIVGEKSQYKAYGKHPKVIFIHSRCYI
jgi:hypothetical protein